DVPEQATFKNLIGLSELENELNVKSLELLEIDDKPYYWINEEHLYNAVSGAKKKGITKQEAIKVAERYMLSDLEFDKIQRIESVGNHHEYRGRPLPAYEISYKTDENLRAYVAIENGAFQTVRHQDWRWFDFLWMTHTMDYEGRDNFNTIVLRAFSLLGLITVLSGFLLWYTSSPTIRKIIKKKIREN
ncbi:MAG: hypothetical protein GY739_17320, partial [Mesoflavibacter sp.]|nr:hypothetical protein [Mesoflavibacter sp.]